MAKKKVAKKKATKKRATKKAPAKRSVMGRPPKYRPEFCEVVLEIGAQGGWLCEMAEACDVHRTTMDDWAAKYPDFSKALTRAKQRAQAWFERQGRRGLFADRFNQALWAKQMSARHPREYSKLVRQELSGPDGAPISTISTDMDAKEAQEAYAATLRENS